MRFFVLVGIVLFASGIIVYGMGKNLKKGEWSVYYQNLATECEKKQSKECCKGSVKYMLSGSYKLAPSTGCSIGFNPNKMKCIDSYTWCEPVE